MLKRGRKAERTRITSASQRAAELAASVREKEQLLGRERQMRAELEARSRARDESLALLAHDLRGPLSAVLGWTALLRSECLDVAARDRALATIERCARAQSELIASLLDVSRLDAGRMALAVAPLDLAELVRSCAEELVPSAQEKGVALAVEVERACAIVVGDATRLRQIVTNLLVNAIKFTPPGGEVTAAVVVDRDADRARVRVTDTGAGIAPSLLPHVFECFRQGAAVTTRAAGLGLGLYIVKELVLLHGGEVEARSDGEGKGATFEVTLPALGTDDTLAVPRAAGSGRLPLPHDELDGVRILLVEDEADTREVVAVALRAHGAEVATAHDAESALACLGAFAPDLLVSDISLPEVDGYQLMRMIRKRSLVPALAVSGFVSADDERKSHAAGFDAHLAKPFSVRQLVAVVCDLATSSRTRLRPSEATHAVG